VGNAPPAPPAPPELAVSSASTGTGAVDVEVVGAGLFALLRVVAAEDPPREPVGAGEVVALAVRVAAAGSVVPALLGRVLEPGLRAGFGDTVVGVGFGAAASWGQIVDAAMLGGLVLPPSCQTHASVEPGLGSWVPGPWLA
jgi:hypothetical protein